MKTEKQIKILSENLARQCAENSKSVDRIELPGDRLDDIQEKITNMSDLKSYPIFNEGCIVISYPENLTIYILFSIDGESVSLKCAMFRDNIPQNYAGYIFEQNPEKPFSVDIRQYTDSAVFIYQKQRKDQKFIDEYVKSVINESYAAIDIYVTVMVYINYLLEHPEEKQVERKKRNAAEKEVKRPADQGVREIRPREIKLNGVRILTKNKTAVSYLTNKKRNRLTDSWNVMWHYRHYKDGKVVYIKPYTKGKNRNGNSASRIIRID